MPVSDGFNVLDIMSENGINIPIVLVTAEATAANVQRAAKYSIAGFISKAAYFYDIGLMGVPSELIANADTLTGCDREIYNSHTNMGAKYYPAQQLRKLQILRKGLFGYLYAPSRKI